MGPENCINESYKQEYSVPTAQLISILYMFTWGFDFLIYIFIVCGFACCCCRCCIGPKGNGSLLLFMKAIRFFDFGGTPHDKKTQDEYESKLFNSETNLYELNRRKSTAGGLITILMIIILLGGFSVIIQNYYYINNNASVLITRKATVEGSLCLNSFTGEFDESCTTYETKYTITLFLQSSISWQSGVCTLYDTISDVTFPATSVKDCLADSDNATLIATTFQISIKPSIYSQSYNFTLQCDQLDHSTTNIQLISFSPQVVSSKYFLGNDVDDNIVKKLNRVLKRVFNHDNIFQIPNGDYAFQAEIAYLSYDSSNGAPRIYAPNRVYYAPMVVHHNIVPFKTDDKSIGQLFLNYTPDLYAAQINAMSSSDLVIGGFSLIGAVSGIYRVLLGIMKSRVMKRFIKRQAQFEKLLEGQPDAEKRMLLNGDSQGENNI